MFTDLIVDCFSWAFSHSLQIGIVWAANPLLVGKCLGKIGLS